MSLLLTLLTGVLILVSLFLILVVLMQKSKDGGIGSALGGGAAEAAFGADTSNVLSKSTIYAAILFFVLTFALYLGRIYERKHATSSAGSALPTISAPALPPAPTTAAPATGSNAVTVPTAAPATTTPAATTPPASTTPAPEPKK